MHDIVQFSLFMVCIADKVRKSRGLKDLQRLLVKSMLEEYDIVSISDTTMSKWIQQLLFRHLQQLLHYEVCGNLSNMCTSLGALLFLW